MLNLQTHLLFTTARVWHKAQKLSKSILPSVTLVWVTTSVCTFVYLCSMYIYKIHIWICVYKFMNKKCFSRHIWIHECASLWIKSGLLDLPFQDGHKLVHWLSHLFSYKWGVHCWFSVCSSAALSFLRKYFSQHISIKSTQTWYMYSFMAQAGYC